MQLNYLKNLKVYNIFGEDFKNKYGFECPTGVMENSDNKLIYEKLNWKPSQKLQDGLAKTYPWILKQLT